MLIFSLSCTGTGTDFLKTEKVKVRLLDTQELPVPCAPVGNFFSLVNLNNPRYADSLVLNTVLKLLQLICIRERIFWLF